jgi:hypothetical protein
VPDVVGVAAESGAAAHGWRTGPSVGVAQVTQGWKLPTLAPQPSYHAPFWFMLPLLARPADGRVALVRGSAPPL